MCVIKRVYMVAGTIKLILVLLYVFTQKHYVFFSMYVYMQIILYIPATYNIMNTFLQRQKCFIRAYMRTHMIFRDFPLILRAQENCYLIFFI